MRRCKLCLLPETVPDADLNAAGICALCREHVPVDRNELDKVQLNRREELEKILNECRGKGPYDALVCLSGGKDSLYLLYRLKVEYGLNILAFTTDINIPHGQISAEQLKSLTSIISSTTHSKILSETLRNSC